MKTSLLAATLGAILVPTVSAQSQAVKLELKYQPGTKILATTEEKLEMTQNLGGFQKMETGASNRKTVLITTETTDKGIRRTHSVQQLATNMKMGPGIELSFDSKKPDEAKAPQFPGMDQVLDGIKLTSKAKRVFEYDKAKKLLSAKIVGLDVKKLPEAMQTEFSSKNMMKSQQLAMKSLPTKPVKPGDTWVVEGDLQIGAGQSLKTKTKHTYKGLASRSNKQYDLIETEVMDVQLSMKGGGPGPQMTESDVKPKNSKGKIWFDRNEGRIVAQESVMQIVGSVTMKMAGMEINVDMDMKVTGKSEAKIVR